MAISSELGALPARKPMASARRVSLFEREIRVKLSSAAIDILFEAAQVLSEGQRHGASWFGSTMVTLDLARVAESVRDRCDAATAKRLAELIAEDPRVRSRAHKLAMAEADAGAGAPLERAAVDVRVRSSGLCVHLDLDVEGDLARASSRP